MVKNITEGKTSKQTKREIEFCKNFSNRCFTKFYGLVVNKYNEIIGIVMEYMAYDSLFSYLKDNENTKIDEMFFIIILLRVGQAIEYLHKNSFFHRDIKPGNILIDHDFNPCISDYETIRHPIIEDEEITNDICSKLYAAPELYKGQNVSFPTDIYSFRVLIEELIKKTDIKNVSKNLINLYESCKNYNPDKRPTILQIKNTLLNEFNSFSIFENILTNKTEKINKNFIIQFIYEMILTVIQKQDIMIQKLCFENIFCFRRLLLIKEYQDDSIINLLLGLLYEEGYDLAIKQDLFKAKKYYTKGLAKEYFESAAKQKMPLSINNLGCMYKKGYGVEIDYNTAKKYYELAAELNESNALNNLGNLYENGLGVDKNYFTARYFYEQSAQLMNSAAFFNLGQLYFKGLGVQRNYLQAIFYFEQSAKLNNPDGFCALGMIYSKGYGVQKDYIKAKHYYEIAAQYKDSDAIYELGFFYEKGLGVEKNYIEAKKYYELSANYGNSDALLKLGFFYEKGLGVEQNYNKAKKYYESSVNYDNSFAFLHLGILYYNGIFSDQNYKKTKEYFELSAKKDNIDALYYLGNVYRRGLGVNQDYSKAREYYEKAAIHKHPGSLLNLGFLYTEGLGVDINYKVAQKYYELAAYQKCSKASLNLGIIYLNYYHDYSKAFQHLIVAAQNEQKAMCILGSMYLFGKGVKQDYSKAKYYYELSAKSYNSESLTNLGFMYLNRLGVNKDIEKAIHYFTLAANLGDFRAIYALGIIYSNEMAIMDYVRAIYYFELLANQNNPIGYNYLGYLYAFSPGIKHNYNKAKVYFELAVNLDYLEAFFHLANLYYDGLGIKKDYHKARKYYEIASKQNNSYAYYYLGMIFLKGYGVEINYKISKKYFELSAQLNNPTALFILGNMYSSGEYQEYDIKKAIKYFKKCIELEVDKMTLNNPKYGLESYYITNNYYRYRAMNDLGLIYLTIFRNDDKNNNKAIKYIKDSAFGEFPFGQNNYGLLCQLYINNIENAVYFFTKSSKNNFALAYYNLGYLKEIQNKIDEAIQLYIKASENENKSLLYHNFVHYDKRLHISKIFIICLTNLKLVDYYLSKDDLQNAKKYFIKSFAKFKLGSYQFKFKLSNENKFSYLKYFILNYPSFNLKNQSNLPSDLDLNIFNDSKENKDDSKNQQLSHEEIKMKGKSYKSENCICSQLINNDEKIYDNADDLFIYATSENSLKEDFIREIKEIIHTMSKILYTPPYSILFGRIFISIPKMEEFPYRKNVSNLFYEGFGIQIQ